MKNWQNGKEWARIAQLTEEERKRDSFTRGHSLQRELIPWEINILKG